MAAHVRNNLSDRPVAFGVYAFPWPSFIVNSSVYMVATQPEYAIIVSRASRFYSTIPTLGVDGFQSGSAWQCAQGRTHGCGHWPRMVLLLGCLPAFAQWLEAL